MKHFFKKFSLLPFHFFLVYILTGIIFTLGTYLYIIKPKKLEPIVMYYYNASPVLDDSTPLYLSELRNVPASTIPFLTLFNKNAKKEVVQYIEELMLGPKNIYAKNLVPSQLKLANIIINKENPATIFIIMNTVKNVSNGNNNAYLPIAIQVKERIYHWLEHNIQKYYNKGTINLLIDKEIVKKS